MACDGPQTAQRGSKKTFRRAPTMICLWLLMTFRILTIWASVDSVRPKTRPRWPQDGKRRVQKSSAQ
eukprot:9162507-Pyramimonas_sp.AAC.1